MYKELLYDSDIDVIKGIQFCIMGPEEIKSRSVAEIFQTPLFKGNDGKFNGLFDPRMGSVDHNKICPTCEQKTTFCPGHFGHIVMAKPVFFVQFFDTVRKLLTCVCFRCSKLLVDQENDKIKSILNKKISRQKRWELMTKECKDVKKCGACTLDGCGAKQPLISKEPILRIGMTWKDDKNADQPPRKIILNAEDVLKILRRITDSDAEALGFPRKFNRPEYMICTVLPVPPPSVRPSVKNDTGQRSEDDLTSTLQGIVKFNKQLKEKLEKMTNTSEKSQIDHLLDLVQYEVAAFIDNKVPGLPPLLQRNGRANRSVIERLKSKEGRIRGNLMGKRVDFSARSVISPDPNISIDELGVPFKIAMNLTFPEIVNKYNIDELRTLVSNGPDTYPGAKFVRKPENKDKKSSYRIILLKVVENRSRIADELEDGDVVERHLRNGDFVLFNRQPSLHKMSMMAHRVRVMPYNTFRLNVCVTAGYNADFDGDEMNMHVPQSLQTHEELVQLAAVKHHIISPRESAPIVAIVQDICLGVYRITKDDVRVSEKQLFNLMSTCASFSGFVPEPHSHEGHVKKWTGRQLLSTILPEKVNVSSLKNALYNNTKSDEWNKHNTICIENGQILSGTFDKTIYQTQTHGLVHSIFNEYGPDRTRDFFDDTQKLICNWLVLSGFSVGISDMMVDKSTLDSIAIKINEKKAIVYNKIDEIRLGEVDNMTSKSRHDDFETFVKKELNIATSDISKNCMMEINEGTNRMISMIKSKSKGSSVNVSQMIGCLGQQHVDGLRVPYSFDNRTLPHFRKYDDGPDSRGFIEGSFIKGLSPQEFFFHAMAGREGLIDTAVQTSETGYIQRKLVKAMEDCKIGYDYSVRNASGSVIQFLYGDDGMDSVKIEIQELPYTDMSFDEMRKAFEFITSGADFPELESLMDANTYTMAVDTQSTWAPQMREHVKQLYDDLNFIQTHILVPKKSFKYPICFKRIIEGAVGINKRFGVDKCIDLSPQHVLTTINNLCSEMVVSSHHRGTGLFAILVRANLSPKQVIVGYKLCKNTFDFIIEQVKCHFLTSLATPCDMVGVVAAQSIGEPSTQLTLNTFHHAGTAGASKSVRGVPRLKELLGVSAKIKTPEMVIRFKEEYDDKDQKKAAYLTMMNDIRTVRFKDVVKTSAVYFDPTNNVGDDSTFISANQHIFPDDDNGNDSPWLLRFVLKPNSMIEYDVKMVELRRAIQLFDSDITCMFNDDNAAEMIFRVKMKTKGEDPDDMLTNLKALEHTILETIPIKGIRRIEHASLEKITVSEYNNATNKIEHTDTLAVYTVGSNLKEILSLDIVDARNTMTNDIVEIYETLGVEAVRVALYNEICSVLVSTPVDYRHVSLLIDVMTSKGSIMPISRFGINRSTDIGPLAKASFEEMDDKLINAGIFGEYDRCNGVSANIMLGGIVPCGTGDVEVLIDEDMLDDPYIRRDDDACVFNLKKVEEAVYKKTVRVKTGNRLVIA